jgi:hypothetical protein
MHMKKKTRKLKLCMETLRALETAKVIAGDDTLTGDILTCRGVTCRCACSIVLGDG